MNVDVRVIAATNRDLEKEVQEGRFREDLYYRLKVFPIEVPPLRDRSEDIPMLVWSFVARFAKELRKDIRRIPKETMDALVRYHWPGNVRELKNLIEQAFIVSPGNVLMVRLPEPHQPGPGAEESLEEYRAATHPLLCSRRPAGASKGTAAPRHCSALNPSSLYSKMKKLGIPPKRRKDDIST